MRRCQPAYRSLSISVPRFATADILVPRFPVIPACVVARGAEARELVDAYAELAWSDWSLALNATNLFDESYYSACLARGDCFLGAERNVYATLTRRF